MKCRCASRIGFSSPQRPKYGSAPQLFAYTTCAPAYAAPTSCEIVTARPFSAAIARAASR